MTESSEGQEKSKERYARSQQKEKKNCTGRNRGDWGRRCASGLSSGRASCYASLNQSPTPLSYSHSHSHFHWPNSPPIHNPHTTPIHHHSQSTINPIVARWILSMGRHARGRAFPNAA